MNSAKYIGMDVHTETISVAVRDAAGKLIIESVLKTKASTILQFVHGLRGELHVTFEEGTWAAWLYDLLKPYVTNVVVCDSRRNALLKEGSKSDRIDGRKLSELLRANLLRPVYHGENGLRPLKELVRAYLTLSKDVARVMNRVKAIYRGWGIPCAGQSVYHPRHRDEWLSKITQASVRRRAQLCYLQLDMLVGLRQQARQELLVESKKHPAWKFLRSIPALGPIRAAVLMAIVQTPHRFRTKRPLWRYAGLEWSRTAAPTIAISRGNCSARRSPYRCGDWTPVTIIISRICSRARRSRLPPGRGHSGNSTRLWWAKG